MAVKRVIFHIDMDAFFASVEQRDFPELRNKPVIVGALPGSRGVVCAASYEARKFGVRSAMPVNEAFRRCPGGFFVKPRFNAYSTASHKIMKILSSYTPIIEQISVDEAFLDMSGTAKLHGDSAECARKICFQISKELNLTASAGVAPNKFLAKIASDLNKPNGITVAPFEPLGIIDWLAPMQVGRIWGVGKKMQLELERVGISTVGDLQKRSLEYLEARFKKSGLSLYTLCRGVDNRPVAEVESVKSISREHTFSADSRTRDEWKQTIFLLAQEVARSARNSGVKGHTVVLTYRCSDFSRHSRRVTSPTPTDIAKVIYETGLQILATIQEPALRLIGIGITGLNQELQMNLFGENIADLYLEKSERAVDTLLERFGAGTIMKGTELGILKKKQ